MSRTRQTPEKRVIAYVRKYESTHPGGPTVKAISRKLRLPESRIVSIVAGTDELERVFDAGAIVPLTQSQHTVQTPKEAQDG